MLMPFTAGERSRMLLDYALAMRDYNLAMEAEQFDEAEGHLDEARRKEADYFHRIPRLAMSGCPFDGKPLMRTFDSFGFDGLWWASDASPKELPACPHFCLLLGAVNFGEHPARAGDFEVHPGPQAPCVIPRLLEHPGMIAVVSQVNMENGYVAYPVAYFAERRPPPEELTAGWARTNHVYTTQLGVSGWRRPAEKLDFDLLRWIRAGKVRWCLPDTERPTLSTDKPGQCPYLDLPGERQPVTIRGTDVIDPIDEQGLEQ